MRRYGWMLLGLLLAAGIHIDWHLARGHEHHRLSGQWREHWLFVIPLFALLGMIVARVWPSRRWTVGAWTLLLGVLLAQVVEPVLEVVAYQHRVGYAAEPERWAAFGLCLAVGIPAYALALWLCAPPRTAQLETAS